MKIIYSQHALEQMQERGASKKEVEEAIYKGERMPAKKDRISFRYNFQFNAKWGNKEFAIKQVMPVVVKEGGNYVVVTVYTFYF